MTFVRQGDNRVIPKSVYAFGVKPARRIHGDAALYIGRKHDLPSNFPALADTDYADIPNVCTGFQIFHGEHQSGTVSFVPRMDCEEMAARLAEEGIAVRAGLHCAPLAHESAGTLETGTVRVSFGHRAGVDQAQRFLREMAALF